MTPKLSQPTETKPPVLANNKSSLTLCFALSRARKHTCRESQKKALSPEPNPDWPARLQHVGQLGHAGARAGGHKHGVQHRLYWVPALTKTQIIALNPKPYLQHVGQLGHAGARAGGHKHRVQHRLYWVPALRAARAVAVAHKALRARPQRLRRAGRWQHFSRRNLPGSSVGCKKSRHRMDKCWAVFLAWPSLAEQQAPDRTGAQLLEQ